MQKPITATLIVGSPRGPNSTSNSLGTFLCEKLEEHGATFKKIYINQCIDSDSKQESLLELIDESNLIILSFPLYVDCLHSQVVKTLELIAEHEKNKPNLKTKRFVAIANSGFPEAKHNDTALAICQIFSKQVGFSWAGGLAMGGGGMIAGRSLLEIGGMARNQMKALQITADYLARGEAVPKEAVILMSKLGIPRWLYTWTGNRGWRREAKKYGSVEKMYDKPYKSNPDLE